MKLRSPNPQDPPLIVANNLTAPEDIDTIIRGLKLCRRIMRAPALSALIERELLPSADEYVEDSDLEQHARTFAKTVYHPSCTCKMGTDAMAVVDPRLRVRGIAGLRVADASIMPAITSGNTNAPSIMIGEKAADMIIAHNR